MSAKSAPLTEIIPFPHVALGGLEGQKTGPKTGFDFFFERDMDMLSQKFFNGPKGQNLRPDGQVWGP